MLRLIAVLLAFTAFDAHARVVTTPASAALDATWHIAAGQCYEGHFQLQRGQSIMGLYSVGREKGETLGGTELRVELVDAANYRLHANGLRYNVFTAVGGVVAGDNRAVQFTAPATDLYVMTFCNTEALLLSRFAQARIYVVAGPPTATDRLWDSWGEENYKLLRSIFDIRDFDLEIKPCNTLNAFSENGSGNITICRDLIDSFPSRTVKSDADFILGHEMGHTAMTLWGLPLADNEDVADEFSTVLLLLTGRRDEAYQHAQIWATEINPGEALQKIYIDDRHTLSIQRARNIVRWINEPEPLLNRWFALLAPHFTDPALKEIAARAEFAKNLAIVAELERRKSNPHQAGPAPVSADPTEAVGGDDPDSTVAKLVRLRADHAAGRLSDSEFETAKHALLSPSR